MVIVTAPELESVKEYTALPVPASVGVPDTCHVALPPLPEDFVINMPGGIGVPETKLIFGFVNTLIVEQAVNIEIGLPTVPFTVTEQLFPVMANPNSGNDDTQIQSPREQSFLNISRTYRPRFSLLEEYSELIGMKPSPEAGRMLKI